MISFHRDIANIGNAKLYRERWEPANIDDPERIALGVSRFPWSGVQWSGGVRLQKNFGRAAWCVLDFDDSELTLAQACKIFCDSIHIIGTTKSHQKPKNGVVRDRFRVALRFETVIEDLATYRASMEYYIAKYDADPSCVDGARFFWPCVEITSFGDGYTQEIVQPEPEKAPKDYSIYRELKAAPHWVEGLLRFGCSAGARNTTCFKIGAHLIQCGYSEDEIVAKIMESPIPIGPSVRGEVVAAVRNGAKSGREKMNGQKKRKDEEAVDGQGGDDSLQHP